MASRDVDPNDLLLEAASESQEAAIDLPDVSDEGGENGRHDERGLPTEAIAVQAVRSLTTSMQHQIPHIKQAHRYPS